MFSRNGLALALVSVLAVSCATTDQVRPMVLGGPVVAGWVTIDTDDPEWKNSGAGFGLGASLAEAWYDVSGRPLAEPTADERAEVRRIQGGLTPAARPLAATFTHPVLYGRVVWTGTLKTKSNLALVHTDQGRYEVEVEVTLEDPVRGTLSVATGRGEAVRTSGSVLLRLGADGLSLDETAGSQAARAAIRDAVRKLNEKVTYVQNQ